MGVKALITHVSSLQVSGTSLAISWRHIFYGSSVTGTKDGSSGSVNITYAQTISEVKTAITGVIQAQATAKGYGTLDEPPFHIDEFFHVGTTTEPPFSGPLLRWSPPSLSSPTTMNLTNTGAHQTLNLNTSTDYIVNINEQLDDGLQLTGGRNVRLIGGVIKVTGDWADPQPGDSDVRRRSLYIKDNVGIVHIEGLEIDGSADIGVEVDAINISAPSSIVQVQNVYIHNLSGSFSTFHADALQFFGGVEEYRMDRCTIYSAYQAYYPYNTTNQSGNHKLSNSNFRGEVGDPGGVLFWSADNTTAGYRATDLDNVWLSPSAGKTFVSEIRPDANAVNANYRPTVTATQATWPGTVTSPITPAGSTVPAIISGILFNGIPPEGDFCPAGRAGMDYVSPGYEP